MTDKCEGEKKEHDSEKAKPAAPSFPLKPAGEVVVTHLDSPPPSAKKVIHSRRPMPPVPTLEERRAGEPSKSGKSED